VWSGSPVVLADGSGENAAASDVAVDRGDWAGDRLGEPSPPKVAVFQVVTPQTAWVAGPGTHPGRAGSPEVEGFGSQHGRVGSGGTITRCDTD
jgi:hypothetical protein